MKKNKLVFVVLIFLLTGFFIPALSRSAGQCRVIACKGDVKARRGKKFIPLAGKSRFQLKKGDAIWIPARAEVTLRCPNEKQQVIRGPRFCRVDTLQSVSPEKGFVFLTNILNTIIAKELAPREKEAKVTASRSLVFDNRESFYGTIEKTLKSGSVQDNKRLTSNKELEINNALAIVQRRFDAAPPGKRVLAKAEIYHYYRQGRSALKTAFDHYGKILNADGMENERRMLEEFLAYEVLPVEVTYNPEHLKQTSPTKIVTFSSNFKLFWAAFYFDGIKIRNIKSSISDSDEPQYRFNIRFNDAYSKKNEPRYLFIIATSDYFADLEDYDGNESKKKELLGLNIPETTSGKSTGFGKTVLKIRLK